MMERYMKAITNNGLTIQDAGETILGKTCIIASKPVGSREIRITLEKNGTARIDKPNGTHKWVYEKSPAQINAILKQTLDFYRM